MLIRREDFKDIKDLSKGSHKKVWFVCDECGIGRLQRYSTYLKSKDDLCISCKRKKIFQNPELKKKKSIAAKNKWKESDYRKKVSEKLSIACKKSWENNDKRKKWLSENNPMKNPFIVKKCALSESVSDEEIKELLKKLNYTFIRKELGNRGGAIIHFKCDKGHIDSRRLDYLRHGSICSFCQPQSKGEEELRKWIISIVNERVLTNSRKIISPYEIDLFLPDHKLAIEYNGLYWHSEIQGKDKNYHLNKMNLCNKKGIRLIQIFEDEWQSKKDIVKQRLKYILGKSSEKKIFARKCIVKEIFSNEASKFCEENHIQGYGKSSIKLGLFFENELVSVMTFSVPSISKGSKNQKQIWELNRFCSKYNVIGGFSKLLFYFKNKYEWKVIYSYVDLRWNTGKTYNKMGFNLVKQTKPNYWYIKTIKNIPTRKHRFNFRRDLLEGDGTEREIMLKKGWNIIWDCGSLKYEIKNPSSN